MRTFSLEWRKLNKKPYLYAIGGMSAFSLFTAMLFLFLPEEELDRAMMTLEWPFLVQLVSCVTLAAFAVFGSVVQAKVVLEEYIGKKVLLLFSYPVKREKMFRTKEFITWGITAGSAFAGNVAALLIAAAVSDIFHILPGEIGVGGYLSILVYSVSISVMAGNIGLISLWFGFWKSSVIASIVSALLVVIPVSNLFSGGFFNGSLLLIGVILTVVFSLVFYVKLESRVKNMEVL